MEHNAQNMNEMLKLVVKYCGDNPDARHAQLAKKINEENETGYTERYLTQRIGEFRGNYKVAKDRPDWTKANLDETKIPVPASEHEKYSVTNDTYEWKCQRGPISIAVSLADQMFYEYSKHGLDMSQSQMRQKHDLKIWEWNSIKNTLFLYKDANILSPHTEDNTPREQLERLLDEKMTMKMKDKQRLIVNAYNKETINRYKQSLQKQSVKDFALEHMLDELNEISENWQTKTATVNRTEDFKTERKWTVATIADIHIGARVENLKLTPEYNPDIARRHLDTVAKRINERNPTDVTLLLMGDLIESFTGLNHKNSWQSVEYGMIGAKLIKEAMSILEEFITKVNNVREIIAVPGNHDRMTADNKEDRKGQIAEIIIYMLQRLYGKEIEITYQPIIASKEIDGIQYIITHQDKKAIREGKQAVIDHGNTKLFNVILGAHIHSRKTIDDQRAFRWIITPSIFTGNHYSEENAWFARPGFLTFENDGNGNPIMTDHTIA